MKKRTIHFVFSGLYCIFAVYACLADFGLLPGSVYGSPLAYYTSLSNMACGVFMFAALIRNIRKGEVGVWPGGKFVLTVSIIVTAIGYQWLLEIYSVEVPYFITPLNGLYHLVLPVMFFLDWLLFYRRGAVRLWHPPLETVISLLYTVYILLRAAVIRWFGISNAVLYPYFFVNPDYIGWAGIGYWVVVMAAAHLVLGYGLYVIDRLVGKITAWKKL